MPPEPTAPAAPDYELAAGGVVWSAGDGPPKVAVVRRSAHHDCALPKGRPEAGESLADAALREAQEETGRTLKREEFLGAYAYNKDNRPKVVLLWRMVDAGTAYAHPANKTEIEAVEWLEPANAVARLSYEAERDFLARLTLPPWLVKGTTSADSPKVTRLAAAVATVRGRLARLLNGKPEIRAETWAVEAELALARAETILRRRKVDLDGGWGAVHDAERLLVFGMSDVELLTLAISLGTECRAKLSGWRRATAGTLFDALKPATFLETGKPLASAQQEALRAAVVEAMKLLHEDSDNRYHRLRLVATQLQYLVGVLMLVICAALILSNILGAGTPFDFSHLLAVLLAGALGGAVSAMYQLSRVGEAKVPEALMHGVITSGRPVVAAASALFVYALLVSRVVNLVPTDISLAVALVFSFVAGFSEKFVLGTVSKVVGAGEKDDPGKRER